MWLRYGVDRDNKLVAIEDVPSGKTKLMCPYCGSSLIAKKSSVKEYHFAHIDDICYSVIKRKPRELPILPLYNSFDIFLSGKELEQLKKLWHRYKSHNNAIHRLEILAAFTREKLLEYDRHPNAHDSYGAYQFTDLGKIPVRGAHLEVRGV